LNRNGLPRFAGIPERTATPALRVPLNQAITEPHTPNESSGLPPAGNDDGFAERSLKFLLVDRIHGPQLRQQVVDQQSQTRPRRAVRE
jgi:hypothetical protein